MFLWNDLDMTRRMRINIEKSEEVFVFIDDMGRDFFFGDFAENAVLHGYIIYYCGIKGIIN
mgnify:CR=1 FL=1